MTTFKEMLKLLAEKYQKTQKPLPPGPEKMRRVQEAAVKTGEEVKRERGKG